MKIRLRLRQFFKERKFGIDTPLTPEQDPLDKGKIRFGIENICTIQIEPKSIGFKEFGMSLIDFLVKNNFHDHFESNHIEVVSSDELRFECRPPHTKKSLQANLVFEFKVFIPKKNQRYFWGIRFSKTQNAEQDRKMKNIINKFLIDAENVKAIMWYTDFGWNEGIANSVILRNKKF